MTWLRFLRFSTLAAVLWSSAACSENVHAAFHLWQIKEVFTNADGTVQFIEFFTSAPGESFLNAHNLIITSDGDSEEFVFDRNLGSPTTNKHFLVATAGFGSLPGGVTPDYTLASGSFFNPNAAAVSFDFAHTTDTLMLTGSQIPKDGQASLTDSNVLPGGPDSMAVGVNSPTNFAGAAGSVNLGGSTPSPGDFNGNNIVDGEDLVVWRTNFGATGAPAFSQGNADADGDVDGRDFLIWQRNVGPAPSVAAAAAVPEPSATSLIMFAALSMPARSIRRRT